MSRRSCFGGVAWRAAFLSGLTLALFGEAVPGSAQQVGRIYRVGILSSTDPAGPNENIVDQGRCRAPPPRDSGLRSIRSRATVLVASSSRW